MYIIGFQGMLHNDKLWMRYKRQLYGPQDFQDHNLFNPSICPLKEG